MSDEDPLPDEGSGDNSDDDPILGDSDDRSPLSDLAREIDRRRSRRSRRAEDDGLFEEADVADVHGEEVWDALADSETGVDAEIGAGADATRVVRDSSAASRPDHVVPKASYCQRCRYLSAPPELACERDGSEIVEIVDSERFRVRGCPFVDTDLRGPGDGSTPSADNSTRSEGDPPLSRDDSPLLGDTSPAEGRSARSDDPMPSPDRPSRSDRE